MLKRIATLLALLIVLTAIFNLGKQISSAIQAGGRLDQEADQLSRLEQQNRALNQKLAEVSQYNFVEEVARDKLGMSKPGETVVVIPQSQIDDILGAEHEVPQVELPNWQGWLKLIFH